MKKFFLIILFLFCNISFSQFDNCKNSVTDIYNNIISNIASNFPAPPDIKIVKSKMGPAYISKGTIYIDLKLIESFCDKDNFESKMAYVLSHELGHHYLNHSWAQNSGLSYSNSIGEFIEDNSNQYSLKQKKLDESQADLFGGFFSQISGYQALTHGEETLNTIYEEYSLTNEIAGYPSLDERINIVESNIKKSNDLAKIFNFGNMALAIGKLEVARNCFKEILKNNFTSREIYNNLGLSYMLNAIKYSDSPISKYSYPIFIEQNTRAEVVSTRSTFSNDPVIDLTEAIKYFENSKRSDEDFEPAKVNLLISNLILRKLNNDLNDNYLNDIETSNIKDHSKLNDLKVLYYLLSGKDRKASKIASKGSIISLFNTEGNSNKKKNQITDVLPSYDKINISDFIFGLEKPYKSVVSNSGKVKIDHKKEANYMVYDFNTKDDSIILEVFDQDYINTIKNLNIGFDNVKLIANTTFKQSKENKVVLKYIEDQLISIIFY